MRRPWLMGAAVLTLGMVTAAVTVAPVRAALRPARLLGQDMVAALASGHGGSAARMLLCDPMGLALDSAGRVLVSDRAGRRLWRIDADGVARIVAGTGRIGPAKGDRARRVSFSSPEGIAVDRDGSIYVADAINSVVLRIDARGRATRVAGTGTPGYSGDGGPAGAAMLNRPSDIRLDSRGNLFIADVRNHRVRVVDRSGLIRTVAGTGIPGRGPDGVPATETPLDTPWGIAIDAMDRLLIADSENHLIRLVLVDGTVTTLAGNGTPGRGGDGGAARQASFDTPQALAASADGTLYIGDEHNHAVRVLPPDGTIWTLVGNGAAGYALDGERADAAPLNDPESILVRPDGSVLLTDGDNGRILEVTPEGRVRSFAGRRDLSACGPARAPD